MGDGQFQMTQKSDGKINLLMTQMIRFEQAILIYLEVLIA